MKETSKSLCQNGVTFHRRLALQEKKLDGISRLDFVEIAHVPDMLPSLFPSWSGKGLISTPDITGVGGLETRNSFYTSQAEHFVTAKGLVEFGGLPALVSTTGLLHCTN